MASGQAEPHGSWASCCCVPGCDCNVCEPRGSVTPLHSAVTWLSDPALFSDILDLLISGGASLDNRAFVSLESPLYRSVELDKTELAILLVQHGADPSVDCPFDITILHKACQRQNATLVDVLLHSDIDWSKEAWMDIDIHSSGINPRLLTGYRRHVPMALLAHADWLTCLQEVRYSAAQLKQICRWHLRRHLGEKLAMKVVQLGIPTKLQEYVMMKIL